MSVEFGLRVPTVGKPQDTAAYAAGVEADGFDFMWVPDTPILAGRWRDVWSHLTVAALHTNRLRLGPGVTNPLTRHPVTTASAVLTLDDVSDGRAELVVGTGYSSAYIIGRKQATRKQMRESTELWRSIFSGGRRNSVASVSSLRSRTRSCRSTWRRRGRRCWSWRARSPMAC